MKFAQFKKYPRMGAFFRNYISLIDVLSPKVFSAFVEACESEKLAREAITFGENPLIKVVRIIDSKTGYEQKQYGGMYKGECNPKDRNIVYLSKYRLESYEEDPKLWDNVERITLHEMVHWARYIGGKSARIFDEKNKGSKEAGSAFELKAYGFVSSTEHYGKGCG